MRTRASNFGQGRIRAVAAYADSGKCQTRPLCQLARTMRPLTQELDHVTAMRIGERGKRAIGAETRVTVVHRGWDSVPDEHVARHGFPDAIFLRRHAEWWQVVLARLRDHGSQFTSRRS